MLLRLRIRGFKNLKDVDVRFGPVTCFVGLNAVGKSNVLDAIQFLRALTEHDVPTAASLIRSPSTGEFGPRELFFGGNVHNPISFEADMLVPRHVVDDFGRETQPTTTLLRYEVELGMVESPVPRLVLKRESLEPRRAGKAKEIIGFQHSPTFRRSILKTTQRKGLFISTVSSRENGDVAEIKLHQDGGSRGQAFPPGKSQLTLVGGTNAAEYPTVLAARREMASWQILQLEPSVIRTPDHFGSPTRVTEHGGHVAATLNRLIKNENACDGHATHAREGAPDRQVTSSRTLAEVSNRLAELVEELREVILDEDVTRDRLTVKARLRGCEEPLGPRSLSDGTLRFLALVTLLVDRESAAVLCMEEPENGIHPRNVPSMVELLRDFAVDPSEKVDSNNPLRQVIVNTHSPDVTRQLNQDELLFVDYVDSPAGRHAMVSAMEDTWREDMRLVPIRRWQDFVGGSPMGERLGQLKLPFEPGTAQ